MDESQKPNDESGAPEDRDAPGPQGMDANAEDLTVNADASDKSGNTDESASSDSLNVAMAAESKMAESSVADSSPAQMPDTTQEAPRADFGPFSPATPMSDRQVGNIELLMDVKLPVSIELGRTQMSISEVLELGSGSIIELDKLAGEPVDILVNRKPLAKGEVVVLDENFGVRITSLISPRERLERLNKS
jgi:flagellar motor switch protein FliN/FliY